jgi:UDP-N-acetylmuramate--alanine ligase
MYQKKYHIHFVGIGGIGMSGIAELLLNLGYRVSGSDLKTSDITRRLEKLGGIIFEGHAENQIEGADVVVVSSAVYSDNPELIAARHTSTPVIPRAEMLAELMRLKYSVAIAGAHGKTSTTSMVAAVLDTGDFDPTVVIGGQLKSVGSNALLGQKAAFLNFIDRIPFYGLAVLCLDNEAIQDLIPKIQKRYTTYGMSTQADFQAENVVFENYKSRFTLQQQGRPLGEIHLNLPGIHNVYNSMASVAVGIELGIPFETIKKALETLQGVQRRLEIKGEINGITVVDDYGHHPTEIKTTLQAAKECWPDRRKVVVFQPHRYTRTKALFDDFTRAFYQSDVLVVLPIYAASEKKIKGVNSWSMCDGIREHGHKEVICKDSLPAAVSDLKEILKPGDILLTLGAGDVWKVGEEILKKLKAEGHKQ